MAIHYTSEFYLSSLVKFCGILSFQVISVLTIHFALLFPHGDCLGKRSKTILKYGYLVSLLIFLLDLYGNLMPDFQAEPVSWEPVAQKVRYLEFIILFLGAGITLIVKFLRSRSEERLRLRLAVFSLVIRRFGDRARFCGASGAARQRR